MEISAPVSMKRVKNFFLKRAQTKYLYPPRRRKAAQIRRREAVLSERGMSGGAGWKSGGSGGGIGKGALKSGGGIGKGTIESGKGEELSAGGGEIGPSINHG